MGLATLEDPGYASSFQAFTPLSFRFPLQGLGLQARLADTVADAMSSPTRQLGH